MPLAAPPRSARAKPTRFVLRSGTVLWRVHRKDHPGSAFKDLQADKHFGGNRFDGTPDDPFPYLYAAPGARTALLETLARGLPFNDNGSRLIRRVTVRDHRICAVEVTQDLNLIALLSTADLAAACQDEWLIHCAPSEYPQTRRWAQWLRSQAPWAQGLIWASHRDIGGRNIILFGDRCLGESLRELAESARDLDDRAGAKWLSRQLAPFRISVRPPVRAY